MYDAERTKMRKSQFMCAILFDLLFYYHVRWYNCIGVNLTKGALQDFVKYLLAANIACHLSKLLLFLRIY